MHRDSSALRQRKRPAENTTQPAPVRSRKGLKGNNRCAQWQNGCGWPVKMALAGHGGEIGVQLTPSSKLLINRFCPVRDSCQWPATGGERLCISRELPFFTWSPSSTRSSTRMSCSCSLRNAHALEGDTASRGSERALLCRCSLPESRAHPGDESPAKTVAPRAKARAKARAHPPESESVHAGERVGLSERTWGCRTRPRPCPAAG